MQINGERFIETLKLQRNDALDVVAMLRVELDAAFAEIERLTPKRVKKAKGVDNV